MGRGAPSRIQADSENIAPPGEPLKLPRTCSPVRCEIRLQCPHNENARIWSCVPESSSCCDGSRAATRSTACPPIAATGALDASAGGAATGSEPDSRAATLAACPAATDFEPDSGSCSRAPAGAAAEKRAESSPGAPKAGAARAANTSSAEAAR